MQQSMIRLLNLPLILHPSLSSSSSHPALRSSRPKMRKTIKSPFWSPNDFPNYGVNRFLGENSKRFCLAWARVLSLAPKEAVGRTLWRAPGHAQLLPRPYDRSRLSSVGKKLLRQFGLLKKAWRNAEPFRSSRGWRKGVWSWITALWIGRFDAVWYQYYFVPFFRCAGKVMNFIDDRDFNQIS